MTKFNPPIRLSLDGDALVQNWRQLARLSGNAATGAAVKANGYGLGAREVVARLSGAGCCDFFVAHWAEAVAIADIIPAEQICVLNGVSETDLPLAKELGAVPVLNSPKQIALWKMAGAGRCHVMLDSGINRLGIGPEQIDAALFNGLDIDILASHLASADQDVAQNSTQLHRFKQMATGISARRLSLANSAGIMLGSDYHFDLTRPGLSLYGGIARPGMDKFIKPVVHISAQIMQVRELPAGDPVGYNATYICSENLRVATAAIGYADGYLRGFSGKGSVYFGGLLLPVIGRVSMDLITIDASQATGLQEGDWVDIAYDLPEASHASGLSQYELLTGLGRRSDRSWLSAGQVTQ
jgi:alanine racemase